MKKVVAIVIGLVLLAGGIGLFLWVGVQTDFDFKKLSTETYKNNTYPLEGDFQNMEINVSVADVTFIPAEDGKCSVIINEPEKVEHTVSEENGTLKILCNDQRDWTDRVTLFSLEEMSVTVYLPKKEYKALTIKTNTGDLLIPGGFVFGSIDIETDTGDIECSASVSGLCKIKTDTGDMQIREARFGEMDLTSSTGKKVLNEITCENNLKIKESTGKANLSNVSCKNYTAEASTGDITLQNVLAAENFSIKTDTGDVKFENSDAQEIDVKTDTGDVTGSLRTEKIFFIETSTGDVKYPKSMTGGKCEITTSTGDVELDLAGN